MRILWFANTPCGSSERLGYRKVFGGWLVALEKALVEHTEIEIGVCFYHDQEIAPFFENNVQYFPVKHFTRNKFKRWYEKVFNLSERKQSTKKLIQVVDHFKPDIIHIHGTENNFGLIQKYTDIPVVISVQGNLTVYKEYYFRGLNKFHALHLSYLKSFFLSQSPIQKYTQMSKRAKIERSILANTKFIFGRTDWDFNITRILAPESQYFHNNELIRESFYTSRWNSDNFRKMVLFSTVSDKWYKGLEMIFKTAILLKESGLDLNWRIAGMNKTSLMTKTCERIFRHKADSIGICFLGLLDEDKLSNELSTCSLYVQTSHIENSPNSICEAMMVGTPIISSFAGGTHSLFTHETEGLFVQDGDAYALGGAIVNIFSNPDKAMLLARNGQKRAEERHDPKKVANSVVDSYEQIYATTKNFQDTLD